MTDAITIDDRCASAINSSNLRVEADRTGDADTIIAMGMSSSRLGGALRRLHTEFDAVSHPRRLTPAALHAFALTLDVLPGLTAQERSLAQITKARKAANDWHHHEQRLLMGRLKTLPAVRHELTLIADRYGMDKPGDIAAAVLMWFLFRVCSECHGQKFTPIPGTPSLSTKACKHCHATGENPIPYGEAGRRLVGVIDSALDAHRVSVGRRLRPA